MNLVESDELPERQVEESARRVLRTKFELGLFDDPYVDVDDATRLVGSDDHREVARRVACARP